MATAGYRSPEQQDRATDRKPRPGLLIQRGIVRYSADALLHREEGAPEGAFWTCSACCRSSLGDEFSPFLAVRCLELLSGRVSLRATRSGRSPLPRTISTGSG